LKSINNKFLHFSVLGMSMGFTMQSFVGIGHSADFWRSAENPPPSAENPPPLAENLPPSAENPPPSAKISSLSRKSSPVSGDTRDTRLSLLEIDQ
jgi:hypothetical protein